MFNKHSDFNPSMEEEIEHVLWEKARARGSVLKIHERYFATQEDYRKCCKRYGDIKELPRSATRHYDEFNRGSGPGTDLQRRSHLSQRSDSTLPSQGAFSTEPCSEDFLDALSTDFLELILEHRMLNARDLNLASHPWFRGVLRYVSREIQRLIERPELFPTDESKQAFLTRVSLCVNHVKENCQREEAVLAIESSLKKQWEKTEQEKRGHCFQEQRLRWHQFLHNGAPGTTIGKPKDASSARHQVVPPAGLRLLELWRAEDCTQRCDIKEDDQATDESYVGRVNIRTEISLDGVFRHTRLVVADLGLLNNIQVGRTDMVGQGQSEPVSLEALGSSIGQLENEAHDFKMGSFLVVEHD